LQALTIPTGEIHMAELELGMLPRAAIRGVEWSLSFAAVCSTDWKNLPTFGPKISPDCSRHCRAQSSRVA
jgi:hypothetical protein